MDTTFDRLLAYKHKFSDQDFRLMETDERTFADSLVDLLSISPELVYMYELYFEFTTGYKSDSDAIKITKSSLRLLAEWVDELYLNLQWYYIGDPLKALCEQTMDKLYNIGLHIRTTHKRNGNLEVSTYSASTLRTTGQNLVKCATRF